MIVGTLKPMTYTRPLRRVAAVLPQFDPPWLPGMWIDFVEPDRRERAVVARACDALPELLALLRRQDVRVQIVGRERLPRRTAAGWSGTAASATAARRARSCPAAPGRSSIGQIGLPVTRSNT